MSRSKKTPFPPWQSIKPDGIEKRYVRLANSQLCAAAMNNLSSTAFRVYVLMLLEAGGKREFTFSFSKYKNFTTRPTFMKAKDELIKAGFILEKQNNFNLRKANIYAFSDEWKRREIPP